MLTFTNNVLYYTCLSAVEEASFLYIYTYYTCIYKCFNKIDDLIAIILLYSF